MMEGKSAERCGAVWDQARLLYVTTGASCGQVAARLGVSKGAAERRCAAEGWVEQRKAFRKKLYEKALERAQKTGLAVMEDLMRSAESMTERFRDVVEDPQAFRRYLVSDKAGGPKREEIFQRTDMDAFRAASGTLKQMSEAVREPVICSLARCLEQDIIDASLALEKAARKRGFLISGGEVDTERMAAILLDEFRSGTLGRITLETPEEAE